MMTTNSSENKKTLNQIHPEDAKKLVTMLLVVSVFEMFLFGGVFGYSYIQYGSLVAEETIPLLIGVMVITMPLILSVIMKYKRKAKQGGVADGNHRKQSETDAEHNVRSNSISSSSISSNSIIRRD